MKARRIIGLFLGAAAVLLLCLKVASARTHQMDRVGGKKNACACTQRIEP